MTAFRVAGCGLRVLGFLGPVVALSVGAAGPVGAAEAELTPVLRFAARPPGEVIRCFASPVTRTETIFWGVANRGDETAAAVAVELARIQPDGTRTVLKKETVERLPAGEDAVFQFAYQVTFCVTPEPRRPWPPGGRFRVTIKPGGPGRSLDARDP